MQSALARDDGPDEDLRHTGSGVWAVPPGVSEDGRWVRQLFAAA